MKKRNGFISLFEVMIILLISMLLLKAFTLFYKNKQTEMQIFNNEIKFMKTAQFIQETISTAMKSYQDIPNLFVYNKDIYNLNSTIFILSNAKNYITDLQDIKTKKALSLVTIDQNIVNLLKQFAIDKNKFSLKSIKLYAFINM